MNSFKDFNISNERQTFIGTKLEIEQILNREITVHNHKIEPSKFKPGKMCLYMQISVEGRKHVVFTGSTYLQEDIEKIPKTGFPFTTTIVKDGKSLMFT